MPPLSTLLATSASGGGGFSLIATETFISSGTWTKPADVEVDDIIVIDLWGAGGAGASYKSSSYGTGAGGGGQHRRYSILAANFPAACTVAIGSGGIGAIGDTSGDFGGVSTVDGGSLAFLAQGGDGGSSYQGGAGGGDLGFANTANNSDTAAGKWGGGIGKWGASGDRRLADADHGGGAGGSKDGGYYSNGGNSNWGGGGGQPLTDNAAAPYGTAGASVFGGNGGLAEVDGEAPAGGGGAASNVNKPGDGARGEVRIHIVRGSIPPEDMAL